MRVVLLTGLVGCSGSGSVRSPVCDITFTDPTGVVYVDVLPLLTVHHAGAGCAPADWYSFGSAFAADFVIPDDGGPAVIDPRVPTASWWDDPDSTLGHQFILDGGTGTVIARDAEHIAYQLDLGVVRYWDHVTDENVVYPQPGVVTILIEGDLDEFEPYERSTGSLGAATDTAGNPLCGDQGGPPPGEAR